MRIRRLKYYEEEDKRIRDLVDTKCSKAEARALIEELCSAFKLEPIQLFLKNGDSYYITNANQKLRYILLGELNLGTLIHEFAHYWDHMRAYMPINASYNKFMKALDRKRVLYHCKRHAALVDILAEYVRAK